MLNNKLFVMIYRNYYPKKKISEINPETDFRVKIIGFVVDKKDDTIVLDDGSGKVRVFIDIPEMRDKISIHQFLAVFGSIIPSSNTFEIKANVVQDLTGLDINLYKRVDELYRKLGV